MLNELGNIFKGAINLKIHVFSTTPCRCSTNSNQSYIKKRQ